MPDGNTAYDIPGTYGAGQPGGGQRTMTPFGGGTDPKMRLQQEIARLRQQLIGLQNQHSQALGGSDQVSASRARGLEQQIKYLQENIAQKEAELAAGSAAPNQNLMMGASSGPRQLGGPGYQHRPPAPRIRRP